ncbi:alpha-L-rhamnosidase [Microbacterium gorillae]|uniref:alpha-L-rhamnosidase n=1 Tax=Microbacterium gorillae TaxID=1231063 RepID=UPI00069444BF|nr:alpha-L-rhamnosidase [Microbacterium gorillae]
MTVTAPGAQWITDAWSADDTTPHTLYFRGRLTLDQASVAAIVRTSALGWYRLFVNGVDITGLDQVPRWTPFAHYVEFQEYDITAALVPGENTVDLVVSEGRYRGSNGGYSIPRMYGTRLAAYADLNIEHPDGTHTSLVTDATWTVSRGEARVLSADPKFGERVDLRLPELPAFGGGTRAVRHPDPQHELIPEETARVTAVGTLPGRVSRTPAGDQLVDFGQNFAGVARLRLSGPAGERVIVGYSEVLTPAGELDTNYQELGASKTLDGWFQRDEIVLAGEPVDYTPHQTVRGFRYLVVRGPAQELRDEDVEGLVLSTDLAQRATFTSSDDRLNRLHENAVWSLRSNFQDTAMDCPTRERTGWTGDIQVFGATAAILVDADSYLRRYLRNLRAEQYPDGRIPNAIPREPSLLAGIDVGPSLAESTGWGDVATILPTDLHWYTGDVDVIAQSYDAARAWVEFLRGRAARRNGRRFRRLGHAQRYVIESGYDWGEWLRPGEDAVKTGGANFLGALNVPGFHPHSQIATAYFAHSARLLGEMAALLGRDSDARRYARLAREVRDAWRAAFVRNGGARIGTDKQDDYVRALAFGLLDAAETRPAVDRLVDLINLADGHLGTGFLSTPLLLGVLAEHGRADVAYRVLMQTTSPSWLGQIEKGATTIWETWDGYDGNGQAHSSHNHYAFGSVARFLHEYVAGLRPTAPGYARILIAPVIGGGLTSAASTVMTPFGEASASWTLRDGVVEVTAVVPDGVTADVRLGDDPICHLEAGAHTIQRAHPALQASTNGLLR